MDSLIDLGQYIFDFLNNDIYGFVQEAFGWVTIKLVVFYFYIKLESLKFFWGVGLSILDQLNISSTINAYWDLLDSNLLALATYLKIPECLNLIINARLTRFLMDFF